MGNGSVLCEGDCMGLDEDTMVFQRIGERRREIDSLNFTRSGR